jgi:chromosome segregation ATPase
MKDVLGFTFLLLCAVQIQGHSIITGDSGPNVTQLTTNNLDLKTVDLFRQLLNQETLIRMGLEKNLQELKKDVVAMKTAGQKSNLEMADLQREVEQLKQENQRLQLVNVTVKQNIETLESAMKQNIETLESAMKQDIKTLESASQKTNLEVEKLKQENQKFLQNSKYNIWRNL